ncbi:DoxX family protein [Nocardia callitridis]|uniref:DoxX family membrane protein n=1 Tax=Nocardia callitridis TaxID=648753 RepID=A0ABP9KQU2_9NOCA
MTTKTVAEQAAPARDISEFALVSTAPSIGLLLVRVVAGLLFASHGTQKLFGWFGGVGWHTTADNFSATGYNPGVVFGTLAGVSELVGGVLLALGLFTPLAAAIIVGTMLNAINTTWAKGLLGGYELALVYAVLAAGFGFVGAGRFSLDAGRPWQRHGTVWGIGAVVLGVVAAVLTLIFKWAL